MKIVDERNSGKVVRSGLEQGEVYRDTYGNYVIFTDEGTVVSLGDGVSYNLKDSYSEDDIFTPLKASLVIE